MRMVYALLLWLLFTACSINAEVEMCRDQDKFLGIAEMHIFEKFPGVMEPSLLKPNIEDDDGRWKVTYTLPNGYVGGTPVVFIDKESCVVVESYHYQ